MIPTAVYFPTNANNVSAALAPWLFTLGRT